MIIYISARLILGFRPANETSLQSNGVSHWLGTNLESTLYLCLSARLWYLHCWNSANTTVLHWAIYMWIISVFHIKAYSKTVISSVCNSVAHCSRSQDIALFKFQLSYHSNPLQDTCPITSAVLGHLIRTRVPLMFLNWDKKSYQLCEKCATLV